MRKISTKRKLSQIQGARIGDAKQTKGLQRPLYYGNDEMNVCSFDLIVMFAVSCTLKVELRAFIAATEREVELANSTIDSKERERLGQPLHSLFLQPLCVSQANQKHHFILTVHTQLLNTLINIE